MIIYSGNGTGNSTITLPQYATKLNMINDGITPLTVTVGAIPVTVLGLEQFNGDFVSFNTLVVTASGSWRFVAEDGGGGNSSSLSFTQIADIMRRIRSQISDSDEDEYDNQTLVGYLNDAIDWFSLQLIQAKDPEMIKEISLADGDDIPTGYYSTCGMFPIEITGTKVHIIDGSSTVSLRYFVTKPHVMYIAETKAYVPLYSPFKSIYDTILIQKAAILAMNKNEYDVTQDEKLLAESLQAIGVIVSG